MSFASNGPSFGENIQRNEGIQSAASLPNQRNEGLLPINLSTKSNSDAAEHFLSFEEDDDLLQVWM